MEGKHTVGVIGGSGLYDIEGLTGLEEVQLETPFGSPSDAFMTGELDGVKMVFLPRHGRGHRISPTEINSRANIWGMKKLGVSRIISVSAVGSMKIDLRPGELVIIDQFIDRTFAREKSFFGTGFVAHVSMADPTCATTRSAIVEAADDLKIDIVNGGTYLVMEGPQFSSRAESELYRTWGCDVIGMTNMPEAKLAREAEMCYATIAMVTDYDCWHEEHDDVSVEAVIKVLGENAAAAKALVARVAPLIGQRTESCAASCHHALDMAIITAPDARDPAMAAKLDAVAGRVLGG